MTAETQTRAVGIVWFIIGLLLLAQDNPGGYPFFALGFLWIWHSGEGGQAWSGDHPESWRRVVLGLFGLGVVLTAGTLLLRIP
jgi:hypothetical protein